MNNELPAIVQALKKTLVNHNPEHFSSVSSLTELKSVLANRIRFLIETDLHYLSALAYRMDIGEKQFTEALYSSNAADNIAELVLKREQEKIRTRALYKQRKI